LRQSLLEAARGDEARGFVVASTLGQRAALSRAATASLRGAGLWHVVSVSGLHVAVASMLALALGLRMCALVGSRPAWAVLGAWTFVAAYVALTGASAPAVRAGIMSAWLGLGIMVVRPTHGLTTLVLALASMLAVRPTWIAEPGFQLSAVAMAALVTADRRAGLIAQSWRLTWALAPLCLWWFGELSLVGVLLNVVAVPVFTVVVLPAGLIGGLLTPWWGAPALEVAAAGARLILDLAALAATLPTAGRTATAALAGGLLLLKGVRRWRSPPGMLRQPLATVAPSLGRRALDGLLGAPSVALVTVLLVAGSHADAGGPSRHALQQVMGGRSYGIGDPTHRALVVDRPGGGACIDVSRASSLAWARWLEALGMPRPWIVVGRDPVSNEARVRLGGETDDGRCAVVFTRAREPVTGLGGTLRSCRRLGAASPAIVRTDRVTQRWHCAMSSGWRPVP
jgi:ComEC/Rec2-related protein